MSQRNANVPGVDSVILVDATSASETVYLPRGFAVGRRLTVRRIDSSGNTVTVVPPAGESLDGVLNATGTVTQNGETTYSLIDPGLWESFGRPDSVSSVEGKTGAVTLTDLFTPVDLARRRFNVATLPKWRKAIAGVRAGTADAKILCVGDSTTNGGATVGQSAAWPSLLAAQMNSFMVPAANGLAIPASALTAATDSRWTLGTAWAKVATNTKTGWGANSVYRGTSSSANLVYADPRVNADRFDVYYVAITTGTRGSVTITATGGSGSVVDTNTTSGTIQKVTVSAGSAATSNSLTIAGSGSGIVDIVGVEPWLSTTKKVRVGNAGVNGSTSTQWADTSASFPIGAAYCIQAYAPDLTFIQLGVNDAYASTPTATWLANVNAMITAAKVSGDVVLLSTVPSQDATAAGFEVAYAGAAAGLTANAYVDVYGRAGNYAAWNAAGYMYDDRHPSTYGHADEAQFIFSSLQDI